MFDGGREIVHFSVTVSSLTTGVFKLPDTVTEVETNAFASLLNAKKVILKRNVNALDKDSFAGTTLSQLIVNSKTLTLPDGFAYSDEVGLAILCLKASEMAKQLVGEDFADANLWYTLPNKQNATGLLSLRMEVGYLFKHSQTHLRKGENNNEIFDSCTFSTDPHPVYFCCDGGWRTL